MQKRRYQHQWQIAWTNQYVICECAKAMIQFVARYQQESWITVTIPELPADIWLHHRIMYVFCFRRLVTEPRTHWSIRTWEFHKNLFAFRQCTFSCTFHLLCLTLCYYNNTNKIPLMLQRFLHTMLYIYTYICKSLHSKNIGFSQETFYKLE